MMVDAQNDFTKRLSLKCEELLGIPCPLEPMGKQETDVDATRKFLLRKTNRDPWRVVACSSEGGPEIVSRGMQRAREIKAALGQELGRPVLTPICEGRLDGRSFAVFPYYTTLSRSRPLRWIQRAWVRREVFKWLFYATRQTLKNIPKDEWDKRVITPLAQMSEDNDLRDDIRRECVCAIDATQRDEWIPKHSFMHDDFWDGNIMIDQNTPGGKYFGRFIIIDWPGAKLKGYPLWDFVRLALSFRLKGRRFFRELDRYCSLLDCDREGAKRALLVAMADLGTRLEYWPHQNYVTTVHWCFDRLVTGR